MTVCFSPRVSQWRRSDQTQGGGGSEGYRSATGDCLFICEVSYRYSEVSEVSYPYSEGSGVSYWYSEGSEVSYWYSEGSGMSYWYSEGYDVSRIDTVNTV